MQEELQERLRPFQFWLDAKSQDQIQGLKASQEKFREASEAFFNNASRFSEVAAPYYEYSVLLEAFETIQTGRAAAKESDFDKALSEFTKASEILRSTVHFSFLSPYVAGCASFEFAADLEKSDADRLQAYKNSIALFEQSKLALSFRDETNELNKTIDRHIRLAISEAMLGSEPGNDSLLEKTKIYAAGDSGTRQISEIKKGSTQLDYFPVNDFSRALNGAFLVGYLRAEVFWVVNLGRERAQIYGIGNLDFGEKEKYLAPGNSMPVSMAQLKKMKIRINYKDCNSGVQYDEGCFSLI